MAPTKYNVIFDAALSKLKDYDFANLSQEQCYSILAEHIRPAIIKFKCCRQDLQDRDDELREFNLELTDEEIEILANEVVRNYIYSTYIRSPLVLKPTLSSRDFNVFSNANHLDKLLNLHEVAKRENAQLISAYSWEDSDLFKKEGEADEL